MKIRPSLWYDKEAVQAAKFYASVFKPSKILSVRKIKGTPSGTVDMVDAEFWGMPFFMMSAGPLFKFNPSISLLASCRGQKETAGIWKKLSKGGKVLMEFGEYPFSRAYGWAQDKFGLSWQVMDVGARRAEQRITPSLTFVGEQCGKALKAVKFYASVFGKSKVGEVHRKGSLVEHVPFKLEGVAFTAMDSDVKHEFGFNEAVSFIVDCKDQEEIDYYWKKLSSDPRFEQCGWLKDKFGVSWQVNPRILDKMMKDKDPAKVERVTQAFLQMKKFDIEGLKRAFAGN